MPSLEFWPSVVPYIWVVWLRYALTVNPKQ